MTGWFEYYLHCDATYEPWVFGSEVQADLSAGYITYNAVLNPVAPTGITASGTSCITINRNLPDQCAGITGWRVYRSITSGSGYVMIGEITNPATTSWTDNNTAGGTTYYYVVRDYFGTAESPNSNEASITTSSSCGGSPPPGTVGDNKNHAGQYLTVTKYSSTLLTLSWGTVCNSSDYSIYRGTLPISSYNHTSLSCSTGGAISYNINIDSANYYFLVVAMASEAEGSYGENSSNSERPQGISFCHPQTIGSCN